MPDNADEDWRVDGLRCRNLDYQGYHPHDVPISWTLGLLDLPAELQIEIFLNLFNQQSVVALRLTCRKLEDVYQRIADTVRIDQRERIIEPIRNYIQFLDRFKLPEGRIHKPPPGG
ncbi:hypothetical protein F5X68DRAFT_257719 [Plectosphaerella plurivora]|uniref:F-box domain-containing protein n=1 Tax=Plectosphaerella plurivora TaxID=936078 RepID=A0A9P8VPY9_9PEZI|nr:hypothetical protein F5X68DRAFT_257719 [Plectosphaerella plurivora]